MNARHSLPPRGGHNPKLLLALAAAGLLLLIVGLMQLGGNQPAPLPIASENPAPIARPTLSIADEIALGRAALREWGERFGGLSRDARQSALLERIGQHVVRHSDAAQSPWPFNFHLLAAPDSANIMALPGGQIGMGELLLNRMQTEGQLAALVAHEIAHVMLRHATQQTTDPQALIGLRYTPAQEAEADQLGLRLMAQAGYDPRALQAALTLVRAANDTTDTGFFAMHPDYRHRDRIIADTIATLYPDGIPAELSR